VAPFTLVTARHREASSGTSSGTWFRPSCTAAPYRKILKRYGRTAALPDVLEQTVMTYDAGRVPFVIYGGFAACLLRHPLSS
jgi:hypothetical protein